VDVEDLSNVIREFLLFGDHTDFRLAINRIWVYAVMGRITREINEVATLFTDEADQPDDIAHLARAANRWLV
jgi:hypothetical protein